MGNKGHLKKKLRPLKILGSMKCGTTTLYNLLKESPHLVPWALLNETEHGTVVTDEKEAMWKWRDWRRCPWPQETGLNATGCFTNFVANRSYPAVGGHRAAATPALFLEASPQQHTPVNTVDLQEAFREEAGRIQYVSVLCQPTSHLVSGYWHAHDALGLTETVSQVLYVRTARQVACLRRLAGDDMPPWYVRLENSSGASANVRAHERVPAAATAAMGRAADAQGFPELPPVDWDKLPDDWWSRHCLSVATSGMFAQQLRHLMWELFMRPLGAAYPAWDSPDVEGLLSPDRQRRVLVLDMQDMIARPRAHVDMVLRHAGLPTMYGNDADAGALGSAATGAESPASAPGATVTSATPSRTELVSGRWNYHQHQATLDPRVRAMSDRLHEHEMQLLRRLTGRDWSWFADDSQVL